MYIHRQQASNVIRESQPNARDAFLLCDVADLPNLITKHCGAGPHDYGRRAIDTLAGKNTTLTAKAEKYMHRFEEDIFSGQGWEVRDSVVGSYPNIPALLAGVPCAMRLRQRTTKNIAPLTLYLELTGSADVCGDAFIERGAAVLALARLLSNTRPVEVWTCTTYGNTDIMQMIACKLETNPLDVMRGAALLCDETVRGCGHQINIGELGNYRERRGNGMLGWAYGVPDLERKYAGQILAGILNPGSTMIYVPAPHSRDALSDPAMWIRDMLKQYGPGAAAD